MLSSGFASSTRKSALLLASIVPTSVRRRNCAPLRVAATITCIGVIPAATMSSISTCGAYGVLPSVPTTILMPAALSFARLRAWMLQKSCAFASALFAASILAKSAADMPSRRKLKSVRTPRSGMFGPMTKFGFFFTSVMNSSSTSLSRTSCAKASTPARSMPFASSSV